MSVQPALPKQTDQDESKGAVEGDRPTDKQQGNENADTPLGADGLPKTASRSPRTSSARTRIRPKARELTSLRSLWLTT